MIARFARSVAHGSLLLLLLAGAASAQQFEYAAGSWHYRVVTNVQSTQEVMGQKSEFTVSSGEKFSMTLTRQASDTIAMSVIIDSLGSESPMGPTPGLQALVGSHVLAWLSPSGQLFSSKVDAADPAGQLAGVGDEVTRLLPRVRKPLQTGTTWSDTIAFPVAQGGMNLDRRVVSDYTVAGDTVIGQQKAWKLARKSTSTSTGHGTTQGQEMTIEGTSTGNGVLYLTAKGAFVGGENSEEAMAKITVASNGVEVHVGSKAKTTIERLD